MTNAALRGKPYAGNPHVRFDEGEVASAATPRRGSLLYKRKTMVFVCAAMVALAAQAGANNVANIDHRRGWPRSGTPKNLGKRGFIEGTH